jgi:hypothetical protein
MDRFFAARREANEASNALDDAYREVCLAPHKRYLYDEAFIRWSKAINKRAKARLAWDGHDEWDRARQELES